MSIQRTSEIQGVQSNKTNPILYKMYQFCEAVGGYIYIYIYIYIIYIYIYIYYIKEQVTDNCVTLDPEYTRANKLVIGL